MKHLPAGMIAGLLLGFAAATVAEDVTVQTYYPSPKGVYEELRTTGDVGIGIATAPGARLRVVQPGGADALRVDDQGGGDPSPFVINQNGDVGIGMAAPQVELHVKSNTSNADIATESSDGFKWTMSTETGTGRWAVNRNIPGDLPTIISAQSGQVYFPSGNVGVGTTNPGTARLAVVGGSVGIGTTAPTAGYSLDVNGSAFVRQNLRLRDGGGNEGDFQFSCTGGQCYATYAP